jgi:hypothetical protein
VSGTIIKAGATVSFSASITDAGTSDTHTCTITWGDGSTSTGTVSETGGAGTCASSHTFKNTGSYTISVTAKDNAGASASASVTISATKSGNGAAIAYSATPATISSDPAPSVIRGTLSKIALPVVHRNGWLVTFRKQVFRPMARTLNRV